MTIFPSLPPLGRPIEPAPYDFRYWQDATTASSPASGPSTVQPYDYARQEESPSDTGCHDEYNVGTYESLSHAEMEDLWKEFVQPDCFEQEEIAQFHAWQPDASGDVLASILAQPFPDSAVSAQSYSTVPAPPPQDDPIGAPTSPPALAPPVTASTARSPFAHVLSPPQQRSTPTQGRYNYGTSPHTSVQVPVPAPALPSNPVHPEYSLGPPYHTGRARRGRKRGRTSDNGPHPEGRTSKRPRLTNIPQEETERQVPPVPPVASSSRSAITQIQSHSVSRSYHENLHTSSAHSPPSSWVVASTSTTNDSSNVPVPLNITGAHATVRNLNVTPVPGTGTHPSLTPAPRPAFTPASILVPLQQAGWPVQARDLPRKWYEDVQRIGGDIVQDNLSSSDKAKAKAKDKPKPESENTKAKKAKKKPNTKKKKSQSLKREKYFCPFYIPPPAAHHSRHRTLFRVHNPTFTATTFTSSTTAAPAASASPQLVTCTNHHRSYSRPADALRHALWAHAGPGAYCIEHPPTDEQYNEPFNRADGIKRHLITPQCMGPATYAQRVRAALAADPQLRFSQTTGRPRAPDALWRACENALARTCTRIRMPCYQDPRVQCALGTVLYWRRKTLEEIEGELAQRTARPELFEKCACAPCRAPRQVWAEEWYRGRREVPAWWGERVVGDAEDENGDGDEDEDEHHEEVEVGRHVGTKASVMPNLRGRHRKGAADDDRLSPEPEEGVDEENEPIATLTVARPAGPSAATLPTASHSQIVPIDSFVNHYQQTSGYPHPPISVPELPVETVPSPTILPLEDDTGVDWGSVIPGMTELERRVYSVTT